MQSDDFEQPITAFSQPSDHGSSDKNTYEHTDEDKSEENTSDVDESDTNRGDGRVRRSMRTRVTVDEPTDDDSASGAPSARRRTARFRGLLALADPVAATISIFNGMTDVQGLI